jgi:hypothetical protein
MTQKQIERQKPTHEPVFIPVEQYRKLEGHAKQKGVTVDQEAEQLINVAVKTIELLVAAKSLTKGGDTEL